MKHDDCIEVVGAKEHNLKNISVEIPKNKLVVITGLSGSGKSSLAFDTIYAEGQRRYMETFGAYARQFIGKMDRPNVEQIKGLSPVISIEQKTTGWNPRSTVGTITEIYDFLRLLYARIGDAYSHVTGQKMIRFTEEEMIRSILERYADGKVAVLAPVVRGRKGHYRELLEQIRKQGHTKVRINGQICDLVQGLQVERFKTHDIEIVIDRLQIAGDRRDRLAQAVSAALRLGNSLIYILDLESMQLAPYSKTLMDPESGISYEEPSPNSFSFNSPYGACPQCDGIGTVSQVDALKVIPDDSLGINQEGIKPFGEVRDNFTFQQLRAIAKKFGFSFATPVRDIPQEALHLILHGGDDSFRVKLPYSSHDFTYDLAKEGLHNMLVRWQKDTSSEKIRSWAEGFMKITTCEGCQGQKLRLESRHFRLAGQNISDLANMDLHTLYNFIDTLVPKLGDRQRLIGKEIIKEIKHRLGFLLKVGLDYLSLNRPARTLSGGESQRTRLANQIGSQLTGITYILDEPSIGLHQRDNQRLIESLHGLVDIGNTVLVVEHDKNIMLAAHYLIDLGPGAGAHGGQIMDAGSPTKIMKGYSSIAGYLNNAKLLALPETRRKPNGHWLTLKGASGNNLQHVDLALPLGTLVCVTGVSGSGKSSLINETLYPILRKHFYGSLQEALPYEAIEGVEQIDKVIEIDQSPIGRTPRSNPATYTNVFTDIRNLFAQVPEARIRGYKPGRFSFNVAGGRCETCQGAGMKLVEMNFLPDVLVDCETCQGQRYNRETLEILYRGRSISDVLDMSVHEAVEFFVNLPKIYRKLQTLADVGLGYITLGQQATTLSGGEAQRVKLAEELAKRDTGATLYILDEPTTGLHFEDIKLLLEVLQKLVDKGNTVVVIEHNLDVIKMADYIIDVGPDAGARGGQIVAVGAPEELAKSKVSITGQFLKRELDLYRAPKSLRKSRKKD